MAQLVEETAVVLAQCVPLQKKKKMESETAREMLATTYLLLCLICYQAYNGYRPLLFTDTGIEGVENQSWQKDWCYFYVVPWFIVSGL